MDSFFEADGSVGTSSGQSHFLLERMLMSNSKLIGQDLHNHIVKLRINPV